jgi:hypothetical protein
VRVTDEVQSDHVATYKDRQGPISSSLTFTCSCDSYTNGIYNSKEAAEQAFQEHVTREREKERRRQNPRVLEEPAYLDIPVNGSDLGSMVGALAGLGRQDGSG